jgi:hypothetical protein
MDGYLPWANKAGKTALARAEAERAATAESARKLRLRAFALDLAGKARKGQITDGAGFVQVVDYAAGSVAQIEEVPGTVGLRAVVMMDDLKRVLIGDGFTNTERNKGQFALPYNSFRDTGFQERFRDGGNQVQHAMAGIFISFAYGWFGETFVMQQEDEKADTALYEATFPLGTSVRQGGYLALGTRIRSNLLA